MNRQMACQGKSPMLFMAALLAFLITFPGAAFALTVGEVVKDLACPCECPLVLEDCNMTCGLEWKNDVGAMIKKGMSKQEIMNYFIKTYGDEARLTTLQKIRGKTWQYTRGFTTMEWAILWAGLGFWMLVLFFGVYMGVKKLRSTPQIG